VTTPAVPLTDAELMARTRGGDIAAYDELYRRHIEDARRVARIVTDNSDEADDVAAEAFTRVLARLQSGGGPEEELTPYLRTVVRRLAVDRYCASHRDGLPSDQAALEAMPEPDDPVARATDRAMVRQAFESLPDRWQRVLWHTEIEGRPPATLAPAFGATPNAVAALAYRAREGLRQAYLSVHLSSSIPDECQPYVPKLTAYVRGTLSPNEDRWVAAHLDACERCGERREELLLLVADLRGVLWPTLLAPAVIAGGGGAAVAGTVGAASSAAGAVAGAAGSAAGVGRWYARIPRPKSVGQAAAVAASAAAAAAVVVAAVAIGNSDGPPREEPLAAAPSALSTSRPSLTPTSPSPTPVITPTPTPEPAALPPAAFVAPAPELQLQAAVPEPNPPAPPSAPAVKPSRPAERTPKPATKPTAEPTKSPEPTQPPKPTHPPPPGPGHPPWW
jgi:RNA polymerase sigma factor (sigma-70 family)